MKRYLVLFLLFLISERISSQILPSTFGIYKKPDGIIKNNLILHLNASKTNSLDQNDLTAWNDLSSSDNDFTIKNGAVSYSSDGGGSLLFDGNDYFCIESISNLNTTNLTISLWIKATSVSNIVGGSERYNGVLAQLARTPNSILNEFQFTVKNNTGKLSFWDHDGAFRFSNSSGYSNSSVYENPNTWKFVTFTKDGVNGKYYINDTLDGTKTASGNVNYLSDWFCIGRDYRHDPDMPNGKSLTLGFEGYIGAVYVYSATLSNDEITRNFNSSKSNFGY